MLMKYLNYAVAIAVATGITFGNMKSAHADLVFEDDLKPSVKSEDQSSEAHGVQKRAEEKENLSKSETMRRQRLREELKNEDLLTQKLEELRLKDEMKRTDELLGSGVKKADDSVMQEQRVGSAAAESKTMQTPMAQLPAPAALASSPGSEPVAPTNQTVAEVKPAEEKDEFSNRVSITPRFGTASLTNSIYDVSAKFSTGLGISVDVTDYIAFEGGYSYSSYSLGAGSSMMPTGFNQSYLQTINMNDNVIDVGMKVYLLSSKSRVRPFLGGGGAYRRGYVNYDEKTQAFIKSYNPYAAQDVEISGFAGFVETGLEFKLTKAISITGMFRYFNLLSSKQSNPLDPNAFLNSQGYGYFGYGGGAMTPYSGMVATPGYGGYGLGYSNDTRSQAGEALAKNNFYQLSVGVSVSF